MYLTNERQTLEDLRRSLTALKPFIARQRAGGNLSTVHKQLVKKIISDLVPEQEILLYFVIGSRALTELANSEPYFSWTLLSNRSFVTNSFRMQSPFELDSQVFLTLEGAKQYLNFAQQARLNCYYYRVVVNFKEYPELLFQYYDDDFFFYSQKFRGKLDLLDICHVNYYTQTPSALAIKNVLRSQMIPSPGFRWSSDMLRR